MHYLCLYFTGVCELEEGEVNGQELTTTSHTVGRLSFGKDPVTKKVSFQHYFLVKQSLL
jgi:hypothetical protein